MGATSQPTLRAERAIHAATWTMIVLCLLPLGLPIGWTSIPPLSDYPNHLARVHVLGRLAEGAAPLPWSAQWAALPNLAVDVSGVALEPLLGLEGFGHAFIAATIVIHVLGCQALSRAILGRVSLRGVIAGAFVWSEPLLLGYASFAFGLALALWALSRIVCALDHGRVRDVVVAAALGLAVAASHAVAAVTLIAATVAFVGARAATARRFDRGAALALGALAPPLVYLGAWWLRSASHGGVSRATPGMIVRGLASTSTGLDARVDSASLVAAALLAAIALHRARPLALRPDPLGAAAVLALLVAVFPSDVAGGIEVHGRFALGAWTLALFAFDRRASTADGGSTARSAEIVSATAAPARLDAIALAAIALLAIRMVVLGVAMREIDHEARDIRELLAREVPEGAALGVAWFFPESQSGGALAPAERVRALATLHVPTLAIVDKKAEVPTLYDLPGAQPIRYEGVLPRKHRYAADAPGPRAQDLLYAFEMVWLCGGPPDLAFELAARAKLRGRVGRCSLYRRIAVAGIAHRPARPGPADSRRHLGRSVRDLVGVDG